MSNNRKRKREVKDDPNPKSPKRRKLTVDPYLPKSSLFLADDSKQFLQIFKAIEKALLHHKLPHGINKEIAEFATGKFEQCYNQKCENQIATLKVDYKIYNSNVENATKIGYAMNHCGQFCCLSCLPALSECVCSYALCSVDGQLCIAPNIGTCQSCNTNICACCDNELWVCAKCGSKNHPGCLDEHCWTESNFYCIGCHKYYCVSCGYDNCNRRYSSGEWIDESLDSGICIDCYDGKMIKCSICDEQYLSVSEKEYIMITMDGTTKKQKMYCSIGQCQNLICWNCAKCLCNYLEEYRYQCPAHKNAANK